MDAFVCYRQKCKVVSLNLAHPVHFFCNTVHVHVAYTVKENNKRTKYKKC